jgi:hypothetical protein
MPAFINMSNKKFGRLTVIERDIENTSNFIKWICICDCGNTKSIDGSNLRRGTVVSCGCFNSEKTSKKMTTHGYSRAGGAKQATYKIWSAMLQRCNNPNCNKFKRYGGRGITVCREWYTFENFITDLGERPNGLSLERVDNNGNYCKENCKWASPITQAHNRENNRLISFQGETKCLSEWARHVGITISSLTYRINNGWDTERALLTPLISRKKSGYVASVNEIVLLPDESIVP